MKTFKFRACQRSKTAQIAAETDHAAHFLHPARLLDISRSLARYLAMAQNNTYSCFYDIPLTRSRSRVLVSDRSRLFQDEKLENAASSTTSRYALNTPGFPSINPRSVAYFSILLGVMEVCGRVLRGCCPFSTILAASRRRSSVDVTTTPSTHYRKSQHTPVSTTTKASIWNHSSLWHTYSFLAHF